MWKQVIELKENDDDDDDEEEEDEDNAKDEHVVRFFIINNVSRSESRSSEDHNMINDDDEFEEVFDNVWNGHSTIELINDQLCHLRRLYETSTRLLELAQSRRLLAVHRAVTTRLQTVLDVEMPVLYAVRLRRDPRRVLQFLFSEILRDSHHARHLAPDNCSR